VATRRVHARRVCGPYLFSAGRTRTRRPGTRMHVGIRPPRGQGDSIERTFSPCGRNRAERRPRQPGRLTRPVERDRDTLGHRRNLLAVLAATVTRAQSRAPVVRACRSSRNAIASRRREMTLATRPLRASALGDRATALSSATRRVTPLRPRSVGSSYSGMIATASISTSAPGRACPAVETTVMAVR
jgi:hypothetical protein